MDEQALLSELKAIYTDLTGNSAENLTMKTKLSEGLDLSSFGKVRLVCAIEDRFDIDIPNRALTKFKSVRDIIDYLKRSGV